MAAPGQGGYAAQIVGPSAGDRFRMTMPRSRALPHDEEARTVCACTRAYRAGITASSGRPMPSPRRTWLPRSHNHHPIPWVCCGGAQCGPGQHDSHDQHKLAGAQVLGTSLRDADSCMFLRSRTGTGAPRRTLNAHRKRIAGDPKGFTTSVLDPGGLGSSGRNTVGRGRRMRVSDRAACGPLPPEQGFCQGRLHALKLRGATPLIPFLHWADKSVVRHRPLPIDHFVAHSIHRNCLEGPSSERMATGAFMVLSATLPHCCTIPNS